MKILFAASECVPFIKTGGLADVVGALAPVLAAQGHDVRVVIPLYSAIPEKYKEKLTHVGSFDIELGWRKQYCGIEKLEQDGVIWYFMDSRFYFDRPYIYGAGGDEYERYGFFCRGVLNMLPVLDFQPDVIHCHDWQSGMVPALLKIQYAHLPFYANIKTIFTIHNALPISSSFSFSSSSSNSLLSFSLLFNFFLFEIVEFSLLCSFI